MRARELLSEERAQRERDKQEILEALRETRALVEALIAAERNRHH